MPANPSRKATIFLVRRCKWRRASVILPKQMRSLYLVRSGMRVLVSIWGLRQWAPNAEGIFRTGSALFPGSLIRVSLPEPRENIVGANVRMWHEAAVRNVRFCAAYGAKRTSISVVDL